VKSGRIRTLGLVLVVASLALLVVSVIVMARRLSTRQDLAERPMVWFNEAVNAQSFIFHGEPIEVRTIAADQTGTTGPGPAVEISYRGVTERLEIGGRDEERFPGLMRHEDWLRVMPMAEGRARSQDDLIQMLRNGKVRPRMVVAARYPAAGYDPGSWGLVRRRDWRYVFLEFKPDGAPEEAIERAETTYREIEQLFAPGPRDKPVLGITEAEKLARQWQYYAMLQVTPAPLYRAKDKVVEQGMSAMGWTWPSAAAGVIGLMIGGTLVLSTRVTGR